MKKRKPLKAHEIMKQQPPIEFPYKVYCLLGTDLKCIEFAGNQASLGEDFMELIDIQEALDWLVDQFGGKVEWNE